MIRGKQLHVTYMSPAEAKISRQQGLLLLGRRRRESRRWAERQRVASRPAVPHPELAQISQILKLHFSDHAKCVSHILASSEEADTVVKLLLLTPESECELTPWNLALCCEKSCEYCERCLNCKFAWMLVEAKLLLGNWSNLNISTSPELKAEWYNFVKNTQKPETSNNMQWIQKLLWDQIEGNF